MAGGISFDDAVDAIEEVALKKVKNIFVNKTKVLVHVIINGEEIKTTAKHPFYAKKGWVVASKLWRHSNKRRWK